MGAYYPGILHEAAFQCIQYGERGGAGEGLASESRAVIAWDECCRRIASGEADAHRDAVRDGLRQCHDIAFDSRVLAGKEAARPAVAALNLVQNQQDVRLVAQGADRLKERM